MNRLFSLLLIACPLLSFGQAPVLTFDEFYQEGGIYPHRTFHDTTNLAQLNGRGVIWDFSSFDLFTPYGIYAIGQTTWAINEAETPDNDFKEEANLFLRTRAWSDSDEPSRYDYLKILKDTVFQIGESREFWKREGQFGVRLDTSHSENLQPIPVLVTRENSMEMVCKKNIAKILQVQQNASYGATITAKELDAGSFNECFPADTLSFRIYHGNRSQDFIPEITNTAEELLTFLPAQLAFDCDHLQQEIVFLFAMHADGSWDACHTELNLYSENDYCLRDSQWVKICVFTPNNEPVSDVKVNWTQSRIRTNALYQNGCVFQRPDTAQLMVLEKREDLGLGVSAYDLFLINRHILGVKSFTQIEQLIAADINHSGTITAKDLVDLQRFLIGKVDFFSGNVSWLFFPKFRLTDGLDWALQNVQFQFFDPKIFEDRPYEFTAIKVGDVSSIRTN